MTVVHGGQPAVLASPYAAARIGVPGRVRVGTSSPDEVRAVFGAALDALPRPPVTFILYFAEGREELSAEGRQVVVTDVRAEVTARPAVEIVVIGHTDRTGSVAANDALSLRRAERVRGELVGLGFAAERITVAGRGEREPLVPTEDEVAEPRNRRVEIVIR